MKKVSTAATKHSKNISRQRLTIGRDLGDRNSWYCVVDEKGQIQQEQRVRTTAKALQGVFSAMPRSRIALEIGTHSPWISRLLSASVNLTPEVGARLQKGEEFGYFMFGGSDIVMLFQNKKVVIDAEVGKKYLQGQRIGEVR